MEHRDSHHRAMFHLRKGGFHKYLGKSMDEPITAEDVAKGKASGNPHVVKMATFAGNFGHGKKD